MTMRCVNDHQFEKCASTKDFFASTKYKDYVGLHYIDAIVEVLYPWGYI